MHSSVRERWDRQEPELVAGMRELGELAELATISLLHQDFESLLKYMNRNFAIRRNLYGDQVVGLSNIKMIELAVSCGMGAKFTGSGGAVVCMRSNGKWYDSNAIVSFICL